MLIVTSQNERCELYTISLTHAFHGIALTYLYWVCRYKKRYRNGGKIDWIVLGARPTIPLEHVKKAAASSQRRRTKITTEETYETLSIGPSCAHPYLHVARH